MIFNANIKSDREKLQEIYLFKPSAMCGLMLRKERETLGIALATAACGANFQ